MRMERFEPIWSLVVECTVRTLGVVEINVISNAFRKLPLRMVLSPIDLLPFHGGEEGLGYGIVVWAPGLGKGLDDLVHAKQFPKSVGCILRALVTVKRQLPGLISILICLPKGGSDQVGAVLG